MVKIFLLLYFVYLAQCTTYVRTNTYAFLPTDLKTAVVISAYRLSNITFYVVTEDYIVYFDSTAVQSSGWNKKYEFTYQLDFTTLQKIGTSALLPNNNLGNFTIELYDDDNLIATSQQFSISPSSAFEGLLENSLFYYRAQRDGADVGNILQHHKKIIDRPNRDVSRALSFE